jgi:hypothetical protein
MPSPQHYFIRQRPSGKWALYADDASIGEFETFKAAKEGMGRAIKPVAFQYLYTGEFIGGTADEPNS